MVKLEVFKPVTYISYSSFSTYKNCPHKFYLTKLAGAEKKSEKSTYSAGLGVIFDAYIKEYIAEKLGLDDPRYKVNSLLANFDCENYQQATSEARDTGYAYIKSGMAQRLLKLGGTPLINRELYKIWGGVPIFGIPDLVLNNIPVDWKTRGFSRATTPTDGYSFSCDARGENTGSSSRRTFTLDTDNEDWATQFIFYNILLDRVAEQRAFIHEIVRTSQGICFYEHDRLISADFVYKVHQEINKMWRTIYGEQEERHIFMDEPIPRKSVCEKYNTRCEVSHLCNEYKAVISDNSRLFGYLT